ncbi:MAG: tRNA lysidine(34) synthetase TilS [bacterium]|nr:tRNA lysidine(34) synthetase TilS [bacterium]
MSKEIQRLSEQVQEEIRSIPCTGGILLAVSGGPDSIALVNISAENLQIKERMHIAYIHHGLRKNADKELQFVRNLAKKIGVPFHYRKIRVKKTKGISLEEQARIKRYEALVDIARKTKCKAILTAHTMDDQVETVLLNFITGAGLKGLCGMQTVSEINKNVLLIRPFLSISKKQILSYLKEKNIKFMLDESNIDTKFRRNFIRHKVLPLLEEINPGVKKNIYRTSKILSDDFDFINSEVERTVKKLVSKNKLFLQFPLRKFLKMHTCLQRYFIRKLLMEFCNLSYPADFETIEKIRISIIDGKKISIDKFNISVVCTKNEVRLLKNGIFEKLLAGKIFIINVPGITEINDLNWKISTSYRKFSKKFLHNKNRLIAYIDADRIKGKLVLKQPEKNCVFSPLGMKKEVKFKKYWKTHKKQIEQFVEFPFVIENNGNIVWVVGGHISQDYAISNKSRVLEISVTKH